METLNSLKYKLTQSTIHKLYSSKENKLYINALITLCLIFLLIFYFGLHNPMAADDFTLKEKLTSPIEIIKQSFYLYMNWDGRFSAFVVSHAMIYINTIFYSFIVALSFCALLILLHLLIHKQSAWKSEFTAKNILIIFSFLWGVTPEFGSAFLWRTGFFYGIGALLSLLFIFLLLYPQYINKNKLNTTFPCVTIGIFGIILGNMDYNTSILLCFFAWSVLGYNFFIKKIKLRNLAFFVTSALAVTAGLAITFSSPGIATRISASAASAAHYKSSTFYIQHAKNFLIFTLPLVIILAHFFSHVAFYKFKGINLSSNIMQKAYFVILACMGHAAYLFSPAVPAGRAYTFISILWTLAALRCYFNGKKSLKLLFKIANYFVVFALFSFLAITVPYEIYKFYEFDTVYQERNKILHESSSKNAPALLPMYPLLGDKFMICTGSVTDVKFSKNHSTNVSISKLYKVPYVELQKINNLNTIKHSNLASNITAAQAIYETDRVLITITQKTKDQHITKLLVPYNKVKFVPKNTLHFINQLAKKSELAQKIILLFYRSIDIQTSNSNQVFITYVPALQLDMFVVYSDKTIERLERKYSSHDDYSPTKP